MMRFKKRYTVNFKKHMADCEFNYRRLCRLMPGWREPDSNESVLNSCWQYSMGNTAHEMAMLIEVRNSAKYTTSIHIEFFSRLQGFMPQFTKTSIQHLTTNFHGYHEVSHCACCCDSNSCDSNNDKVNLVETESSDHRNVIHSLDARLYHDALSAEVVAQPGKPRLQPKYEYPNLHMYQRDEKSQLNQFLGELLEFCLLHGRVNRPIVPLATSCHSCNSF